ncbi:aldehyde dehydrogenase family protein [Sphingobium sp.]|uniref:aldehyde dehydrogenase family protein n=1 Tax=Sphingobium sp. TaxID=1912891 RepID=UPI0028BE4F97|nr:aldehyde dehydrogenase family protein [Sphingobium sp.]
MTAITTAGLSLPKIQYHQLLIDGVWVEGSDQLETYDPASGAVIASVAKATAQDVDRAVRAARNALERGPWATMSAADRGRLLYRLADLIERDIDYVAALDSYNSGKLVIDARDEAGLAINSLRYYAGWADKIEGATIPARGDVFAYTLREPVGVIGQIIPWNFPLLMLAWKWGPALAAGNTIVMKPAEQTPLSALYLGQLALEAGFPAGVINLLNGPGESVGDAIVTHGGVDKIAFTGSGATARIIQKRAADTLKRCTFELGGKSPIVVFADADLDQAVESAYSANFWHAGQCCSAGTRIYVEDAIRPEFVSRLADKVNARNLGHQLDPASTQGPQVSQEQSDKIFGYLEAGQREGARLVTGGQRHGNQGYFIQPTIFDDVTDSMSIAREEIFGPVASILGFSDAQTVIDRANDTPFGLAAAVFTKNIDRANRFVQQVKAGFVWVNCYFILDASLPFGGVKQSGFGRDNGEAALEQYTEYKTVVVARS